MRKSSAAITSFFCFAPISVTLAQSGSSSPQQPHPIEIVQGYRLPGYLPKPTVIHLGRPIAVPVQTTPSDPLLPQPPMKNLELSTGTTKIVVVEVPVQAPAGPSQPSRSAPIASHRPPISVGPPLSLTPLDVPTHPLVILHNPPSLTWRDCTVSWPDIEEAFQNWGPVHDVLLVLFVLSGGLWARLPKGKGPSPASVANSHKPFTYVVSSTHSPSVSKSRDYKFPG
ncbi:hypothetical protein SAMN05444167_0970 [Terriglobus roseus]|uniref:Uncharacterized protein n=1 Tax=Terriglobus roseus TaxID=392734 RepID=A0A1G7H920_9BACT|nr:hypothetical protein SAMN05444167_0970 [Terriglobus roseus]